MTKIILGVIAFIALCFFIGNIVHWLIAGMVITIVAEVVWRCTEPQAIQQHRSWRLIGDGLILGVGCYIIDLYITRIITFITY